MNFDFELNLCKGRLKIAGPLTEIDAVELKRVLSLSLENSCHLELNIDDVTEISLPCLKILARVYSRAKRNRWPLILSSRYHGDAMHQWLSRISKTA